MTDIDAAMKRRSRGRQIGLATAFALSITLAGCGTSTDFFGQNNGTAQPVVAAAQTKPEPARPRIAMAPVIGAPETVAKQLTDAMVQAASAQRLTVLAGTSERTPHTLRGYVVAAREKSNVKVSYIWDVTDIAGKRVNRITGEELVAANPASTDPWASVTPAALQTIATKSSGSLAAWLPSQQPALVSGPVPASRGATAPPPATVGVAVSAPSVSVGGSVPQASGPARVQQAAVAPPAAGATVAASPPTGSIVAGTATKALVSGVRGAPGDGNAALASAIQRELSKSGVALADARDRKAAYVVQASVTLGKANAGKQAIQIDWKVKDPKGKSLGTVTQKNEIAQGSLDGPWGRTADAVAAAAAQGIVKLMPKSTVN